MTDQSPLKSIYPASADFVSGAHVDGAGYERLYSESVMDAEGFWGREALRLDWIKPFTKVKDTSFAPGNISIKWFEDGHLNVSANCIDRHMLTRANQTAII
uniref:acetyl-coenzyme A synthetase N-terminal domain-containing protein n=1 Tax=Tabrizicola aquatica TaxID=909926 RepID=UPI002481F989